MPHRYYPLYEVLPPFIGSEPDPTGFLWCLLSHNSQSIVTFSILYTQGNKEVDVKSDKEPERGEEMGLLEKHHST